MSVVALPGSRNVCAMFPWDPVPAAQSSLPDRVTPKWVAEQFVRERESFERLLRAHLVPVKKNDPRYTRQWRMLWKSVAFLDRRLRSRLLGVLQSWREAAASELGGTELDESQRRTVEYFARDVEGAIARIRREARGPMAWAGNEFINYALMANTLIEALVVAIDEHRAGNITDAELHGLLATLDIDPTTIRTDTLVPDETRRRVLTAARTGQPLEISK